jgi:peptidoglycan/LPS O-acetylase OafA/YrhL
MRRFYVRRFWRIAPLFYVMMAYYVLYFWLANGTLVSFRSLITSATFTFNLVPQQVTGFVFASWSIGVEMLFYAFFPVLILLVSSLTRAFLAFVAATFIVALWSDAFSDATGVLRSFGSFSLVAHLHYFAAGMLAFFVWREIRWTPRRHRAFTALAIFTLAGLMFMASPLHQALGKTVFTAAWACAFIALILGLSFERASAPLRFASQLGEASFSLYLLHPAIIALMMQGGVYDWVYSVSPGNFSAYATSLAATLAVLFPLSMLTYEHIERRFYWGRKPRHENAVAGEAAREIGR